MEELFIFLKFILSGGKKKEDLGSVKFQLNFTGTDNSICDFPAKVLIYIFLLLTDALCFFQYKQKCSRTLTMCFLLLGSQNVKCKNIPSQIFHLVFRPTIIFTNHPHYNVYPLQYNALFILEETALITQSDVTFYRHHTHYIFHKYCISFILLFSK